MTKRNWAIAALTVLLAIVLSDFVHEKLDRDTIAYINKRDPNILNELDSPAGSFTNTWPGCQK